MQYLKNGTEVELTSWETYPKLRKKNNEITFVAPNSQTVREGDVIETDGSFWRIEEIKEERPASLPGRTFFRANAFNKLK